MKRVVKILALLIPPAILFIPTGLVWAEPPVVSTCSIIGKVESIKYQKEWINPCRKKNSKEPCRTIPPDPSRPEGYSLKISISSAVPIEDGPWERYEGKKIGWEDAKTIKKRLCSTFYPEGEMSRILLPKKTMDSRVPVKKGDRIRGVVRTNSLTYLTSIEVVD